MSLDSLSCPKEVAKLSFELRVTGVLASGNWRVEQPWRTLLREGDLEAGAKDKEVFGKSLKNILRGNGRLVLPRCSEQPCDPARVQDGCGVGAWFETGAETRPAWIGCTWTLFWRVVSHGG